MLPELCKIPWLGLSVWAYGSLIATAFITGLWLTVWLAGRDGLPSRKVYYLGLCLIPAGLVGAKLPLLFNLWQAGTWQPLLSPQLWRGAGQYQSGFLGALAVALILMRCWGLPWHKTTDAFAPGIALGYAITRIGCFLAGCCWGRPTTAWIGVRFSEQAHALMGTPIDQALLPVQLIGAGASLLILGLLIRLRQGRTFDGQVFLAYLMLYAVARFAIEFWRGDERGEVFGLSTPQFMAAVIFPLALACYGWLRQRQRQRPETMKLVHEGTRSNTKILVLLFNRRRYSR